MLDVVDLFREHGTRDELGLASVRDAFADRFFPGTSTIQTRARYFLIVPWVFKRLEEKMVGQANIATRARRAETTIIEAIEASDDSDGNIGKFAKGALKRLPSSVYWQGLWVWGIRLFPGSIAQYQRSLDRHHGQRARHAARGEERDSEHDDLMASNWHGGLVAPPEDFPSACSLRLSRGEADYLCERIILSSRCSGSLLAALAQSPRRADDVEFVWDHPDAAGFPHELVEPLAHARGFSELMHGAVLLYNLILAQQTHDEDKVGDFRGRMEEWSAIMAARGGFFATWERGRFWHHVLMDNPRVSPGTIDFVNHWWDLVMAQGAAGMATNKAARGLITERERRLKRDLARIDNPRARELWNGDSGTGRLDFRWQSARRILSDIFDGLEADDA